MSTSQYVRLIAMSVALVLWSTVLISLTIWENTVGGLRPWVSWEHVHSNWNRVDAYVWMSMSPQSHRLTLLFWCAIPVSSIISFGFLGFGEDAFKEYRRIGEAVMGMIPSGLPPRRNEGFGKRLLPGLRFVLFTTLHSNPSHPFQRSIDGWSAPLLTNVSATSQKFQELPPIQLQSLYSMIGLPPSRTPSQSSGKPKEWRWSAISENPRPVVSSELDSGDGRLYNYAPWVRTVTIAEPREVLTRGSIPEAIQRSPDQV